VTGQAIGLSPPHLVAQCDRKGDSKNTAPIVIAGVLVRDSLVHRPIPMHSDPKVPLQLRKVAVQVENVLKGGPVPKTVTVYYFSWAGGFDGPRPLGFWQVGGRRIFWLRRDSGSLRTACDGWDGCTMEVQSGSHLRYRPNPNKPLDYALADLLLTRGEGVVSEIGFATEIAQGVPDQGLQGYVVEKLRYLAVTERGDVKASACKLLWIYTVDRVDPKVRRDAENALHAGNCRCTAKPDGNAECQ